MSPRVEHHERRCDTKPGLASRQLSGEHHLTIRPITDTFSSPWKPRWGMSLIVEVGALATLGVRNEDVNRVKTGLSEHCNMTTCMATSKSLTLRRSQCRGSGGFNETCLQGTYCVPTTVTGLPVHVGDGNVW